jgi:hypothetical protein
MASKSAIPTRASTRTKAVPAMSAPTTTRTTRARTKAAATAVVEPEPAVVKKVYQRKPLISKDNAVETKALATKLKPRAADRKATKPPKDSESEPIMVCKRIFYPAILLIYIYRHICVYGRSLEKKKR